MCDPDYTTQPRCNSETVEATKIRSILKETAITSRGTPAQILAEQTAHVLVEIRAALGVRESIKRSIRRKKAKLYPKDPAGLPELVIQTSGQLVILTIKHFSSTTAVQNQLKEW